MVHQVLHLMNKMNLPAPFRPALPTPPLPPPPPEPAAPAYPDRDLSSDESEIESSEEVENFLAILILIYEKRLNYPSLSFLPKCPSVFLISQISLVNL